jgi:glycosyltransferase involved in cell wall biosynthesis
MESPRLSIIVPVYNEEATIRAMMDRLVASCGNFAEIIYVNDGSRDQSLQLMLADCRPQDQVLTKQNGGKGSAVRMGYGHAKGKYTIVQDADLEYDPEEIPLLLELAEEKHLPAVFGSRRLKQQKQYVHFATFVGGTVLTYACNFLYGTRLTDQPTCYKMVRTDIIRRLKLKEDDFRFDPELTVLLARNGIPIAELPISYHPRTRQEGKKINWMDWFKWMWVFGSLRIAPYSRWQMTAPMDDEVSESEW